MKKITIEEKDNGYLVKLEGTVKSGEKVYRAVDDLKMIEVIAEEIHGRKVKVIEQ